MQIPGCSVNDGRMKDARAVRLPTNHTDYDFSAQLVRRTGVANVAETLVAPESLRHAIRRNRFGFDPVDSRRQPSCGEGDTVGSCFRGTDRFCIDREFDPGNRGRAITGARHEIG